LLQEAFVIEIDGSVHSGSGTLLRYALAICTLIGEPLHLTRIRARKEKPGLMPQHLQTVRACSCFSDGQVEGDELESLEILYRPGKSRKGGNFQWDIGTAGSTTMLAFILIPLALLAKGPCQFSLKGGLFQDNAPSAFHMQKVLIPILQRVGAKIQVEILRPGYLPRGQGELKLEVEPAWLFMISMLRILSKL
jgi:RNA 3'-terminal phosphate cyclase (ATP)